MNNPLLDFTGLPLFDRIRPEHVEPAIKELLAQADAALETVTQPSFAADWLGISKVLDTATEKLGRAWGAVSHLQAVADTPELRAAYNAQLPLVTEFWTRLGANEALYAKYKAMDVHQLNAEQQRNLGEFVSRFGGSFLMVAGKRFSPNAWRNTPVEQILPVEFDAQNTAAAQFGSMVGVLNTQTGNRYLFSGTAFNTQPVTNAGDIINGKFYLVSGDAASGGAPGTHIDSDVNEIVDLEAK